MSNHQTMLERAFALAESGKCQTMISIRKQLKAEGFAEDGRLHGSTIRAQMIKLIAAAKAKPSG